MIARFHVLLPFPLYVAPETIDSIEIDWHGLRTRVFPPFQSVDPTGKRPLTDLKPALLQQASGEVVVNGNPTIRANLLRIEICAPEFDRRMLKEGSPNDPPLETFFAVANWWLARLRSAVNAAYVSPISDSEPYLLEFLDDDGNELPDERPHKYRQRFGRHIRAEITTIDSDLWSFIEELPFDYKSPVYQDLILDAYAAWPEIGSSLVLALASLETIVERALAAAASGEGTRFSGLWNWVSDNQGRRDKAPSLRDQYDELFKIVTGKSLKTDNPDLWEAFMNLKEARNNFIHEGKATIGDKPVTLRQAGELIDKAAEIVRWVEQMLPTSERPAHFQKRYRVEVSHEFKF